MQYAYRSSLRALAALVVILACTPPSLATTEKYRLSWRDDPATTMVIAWHQADGKDPVVRYGTKDHGKNTAAFEFRAEPHHTLSYRGMNSNFARLTNLKPDTAYYFVVHDSNSTSRRLWFRTAPDKPKAFTYIAGGDSRSNAAPRVLGNRIIAKLRPLFVAHGGDYMGSGSSEQWQQWLDEWQHTISPDGRIYPLMPTHGNHENKDMTMIHKLFDMPREDMYHALDIGGDLMRVYTLNTEIAGKKDKWNAQREWLAADLKANGKRKWKFVQYHRPMRAHTSKKAEGIAQINAWAQLFYDHGVDLIIECDTHMVKRTYPLRPDDGPDSFQSFVRDDERGIVFIGEGSWGAPTRPADDDKPWTMASDSFYQFKWIQVTPEHIDVRSVRFDNVDNIESVSDDAPLAVPAGLKLWEPPTGTVLRLPFDADGSTFAKVPPKPQPKQRVTIFPLGSVWRYHDAGDLPAADWHKPGYGDAKWKRGPARLGYGGDGEKTKLSFGPNAKRKHAAYYFRTSFDTKQLDRAALDNLVLDVAADDGFIAYLNGKEVARANMPDGPANAKTFANGTVSDAKPVAFKIPAGVARQGVNTLAIEVHQASATSSDIILDARVSY